MKKSVNLYYDTTIDTKQKLNIIKQVGYDEFFYWHICVENLLSTKEIPFIFKNIKHKNLKICFDTGHKNSATKDLEILRDFGDYVAVLHIHDNFGEQDEHLICGKGEKRLKHLKKYRETFVSLFLLIFKCDNLVKHKNVILK